MIKTEPYFMKNEAWYYYDEKNNKYKLKPNAPREAIQSYKEFYEDEFDYSCQAVYNSFEAEAKRRLLERGIPSADAEKIMTEWNDPKNKKSLNKLIEEYHNKK